MHNNNNNIITIVIIILYSTIKEQNILHCILYYNHYVSHKNPFLFEGGGELIVKIYERGSSMKKV